MKIHIVSKVADSLTEPESTTVGAYVDKSRADAAAKAIAGRMLVNDTLQSVTYGVVETVELDLTGLVSLDDALAEFEAATGHDTCV